MEEAHMSWRKSSYSNGGANACVEVGTGIDRVAVRDTTDRDGTALSVSAAAWTAFLSTLR